MTRRDDGDPTDDTVLDWALRERLGGATPPDLVARVRERWRAECGGEAAAATAAVTPASAPPPRRVRWFAAAAVLLGCLAVAGTWLAARAERRGDAGAAPAQADDREPRDATQEPRPVTVTSLADVAALPADTLAVEAIGADDAMFAALAQLRELQVLRVREPWNEAFGLGLKTAAPPGARGVTTAAWRHLGALGKLRRLEFSGTVGLCLFADDTAAAAAVAALERLPLLQELALRCLDAPDAVLQGLPRLPELRRLDLSFDHGFGDEGLRALPGCTGLRVLSLRGCQQLRGRELAGLAALSALEELDLAAIDGINWRAAAQGELDAAQRDVLERALARARFLANALGAGPTDATLQALAQAPRLRVLDVGGSHYVTAAGVRALGACATLEELDLAGARLDDPQCLAAVAGLRRLTVLHDGIDDAFCAAAREHLPRLEHLSVAGCANVTDRGVAQLCAMRSLRSLDLRQLRWLTAASIDHLAAATWLEAIDLRHCDAITAAHVERLRASLPRLRRLQTSVDAAPSRR